MKGGAIRSLRWAEPEFWRGATAGDTVAPSAKLFLIAPAESLVAPAVTAELDPPPGNAEEEAVALLRIAAEIEGSLLAQYLFAAGSIIAGLDVNVPGFDDPIRSQDWLDIITTIAQQEMGHLITVQNLLLSLGALPHVDRENLPHTSPLFPFPFMRFRCLYM